MPVDTQSEVFWLNAANIALGVVVLVCVVAIGFSVVRELVVRSKRRRQMSAEIDRDMAAMLGGDHVFADPALGLTMADGGEPIEDSKRDRR